MKKIIRSSVQQSEVVLEDHIIIDLDVVIPVELFMSTNSTPDRFPGKDQFRKDVLDVLENEYQFDVIEDVYDGKRQKGHVSNRKNSVSLYFDTYYDFKNTEPILKRSGIISPCPVPDSGKVHCFIHFRFSDHSLYDVGDADHIDYLNRNSNKYIADPSVTHKIREDIIDLNGTTLERCYHDALNDLRDSLDGHIVLWIKRFNRIQKVNH